MAIESPAVRIDLDLAAPVANVWRAWTDPSWVSRWFGSNDGGRVLDAHLDVRVGGRFSVTFVDADGTEHNCSGNYLEVQQPQRLRFTWQWKSEPGVQTQVSVILSSRNDGTHMTFEHAGLIHASSHDYASGWRSTFSKLERVLSDA